MTQEELNKKDEEICRLWNHNQTLLNKVRILKEEKKHYQNQEKMKIVDKKLPKH